jgi:hypothetical protein
MKMIVLMRVDISAADQLRFVGLAGGHRKHPAHERVSQPESAPMAICEVMFKNPMAKIIIDTKPRRLVHQLNQHHYGFLSRIMVHAFCSQYGPGCYLTLLVRQGYPMIPTCN